MTFESIAIIGQPTRLSSREPNRSADSLRKLKSGRLMQWAWAKGKAKAPWGANPECRPRPALPRGHEKL